jgi:hypothetical protein
MARQRRLLQPDTTRAPEPELAERPAMAPRTDHTKCFTSKRCVTCCPTPKCARYSDPSGATHGVALVQHLNTFAPCRAAFSPASQARHKETESASRLCQPIGTT